MSFLFKIDESPWPLFRAIGDLTGIVLSNPLLDVAFMILITLWLIFNMF